LRRKGEIKTRSDKGSRIVIQLAIYVLIIISVIFATNGIAILPDWCFYVGIISMLAGIVFRQWSIWVLGGFFSVNVRIVTGHEIVKEGPYRVIRHPSYTGMYLILIGLGLAFRTWAGTIITIALFAPVIYYRIRVEENALKEEFGERYIEYSKKTKRLVPFIY
jgi:protein-S-isoprenylcysteine O-methyltransferase Ste14